MQGKVLRERYPSEATALIVFIVPGADWETGQDRITGGTISIVSLCEETAKLKNLHGAETIMCTLNEDHLFLKHEMFDNDTPVFRFSQLSRYFRRSPKLMVHVPEYLVANYMKSLSQSDRKWISSCKEYHVNIMNQNIRLMPDIQTLSKLKEQSQKVTMTTAHQKYCTSHHRDLYGVPLHKFSVWISPEQYEFRQFKDKENLLVVSPDSSPLKSEILKVLAKIPGLEIRIIKDLTYAEYKKLIASAKWSLTFGEGLDGYFIEPVFSGAISFAVYNNQFFTPDFEGLPGVFGSIESLKSGICETVRNLVNENEFAMIQKRQYQLCAKYYSKEEYKKNLHHFYKADYSFP